MGITLAMIVRNEEARLQRALESARPWVDEILVCDTGSTDGTLPLLHSMTGVVVYQEPWRADFSWHRNDVASRASHDWILILDGDEEFTGDGTVLRKVVATPGLDSATLPIALVADGGVTHIEAPRLYNKTVCHYEYPVHNQLLGLSNMGRVEGFGIRSYYTGTQQEKLDRSIPMLLKMLDDYGDDPQALFLARYYLAKSYFIANDPAKVLEQTDQIPLDALAGNPHALDVVEWATYSTLALRGSLAAWALVGVLLDTHPTIPLLHKLRATLALLDWYIAARQDTALSFSQRDATLEAANIPAFLESVACPINLDGIVVEPSSPTPPVAPTSAP
jgi:hypothetical protein